MNFPHEPTGSSTLSQWLRQLWRACRSSQIVEGVGYRVKRGVNGTVLEIPTAMNNATVEISVCDPDTGETTTYVVYGYEKPE